jgi:hypothetical protein
MRSSDSGFAVMVVGLLPLFAACSIPLDHEFTGSASYDDAGAGVSNILVPTVVGCEPLQRSEPGLALSGDLRSLPLADGGAVWVADMGTVNARRTPTAFVVEASASSMCGAWSARSTHVAFGSLSASAGQILVPLDLVDTPSGPALFYDSFVQDPTQPLGFRQLGVGLAAGAADGIFVPGGDLLWTSKQPAYGSSVLVIGTTAYLYGCASAGPFVADCSLARADVADLASTAAYSYWDGSAWSHDAAAAVPVASAGSTVSVRRDPRGRDRYVMTYVPPLGDTLVARSSPAPEGPWSGPVTMARCDLAAAGEGSFCSGGQQHPELSTAGELVLSYDARTFASDAGTSEGAFWPRLIGVEVPAGQP